VWIGAGCGGLVLSLGVAAVGAGVWYLQSLRSEPAWLASGAWVKENAEVRARVGDPVQLGWLPQGHVDEEAAQFSHSVSGPKGEAAVRTRLVAQDGAWRIEAASFDEAGRPVPIALGESGGVGTESGPAADPDRLVAEALAAYDAGQDGDAVDLCTRALERDPRRADALNLRGRAHARAGDSVAAVVDFETAVAMDPSLLEGWEGLAWVRARSGDDPGAIKALDELLKRRPGDGKALVDRANAAFRLGDGAAARQDARAACGAGHQPGCDLEARLAKVGG